MIIIFNSTWLFYSLFVVVIGSVSSDVILDSMALLDSVKRPLEVNRQYFVLKAISKDFLSVSFHLEVNFFFSFVIKKKSRSFCRLNESVIYKLKLICRRMYSFNKWNSFDVTMEYQKRFLTQIHNCSVTIYNKLFALQSPPTNKIPFKTSVLIAIYLLISYI